MVDLLRGLIALIRALDTDQVLEDIGGHEEGGKDLVVLADHGIEPLRR